MAAIWRCASQWQHPRPAPRARSAAGATGRLTLLVGRGCAQRRRRGRRGRAAAAHVAQGRAHRTRRAQHAAQPPTSAQSEPAQLTLTPPARLGGGAACWHDSLRRERQDAAPAPPAAHLILPKLRAADAHACARAIFKSVLNILRVPQARRRHASTCHRAQNVFCHEAHHLVRAARAARARGARSAPKTGGDGHRINVCAGLSLGTRAEWPSGLPTL